MDEVLAAAAHVDWGVVAGRTFCDACLGRLFGRVGHGFTNAERGRAVRDANALKAGDCWLCEGLLAEVPKFAELTIAALSSWEYATFLIGSKIDPELAAREETVWVELALSGPEPVKAEVNREVGKLTSARTGKEVDFHGPDITVTVDTAFDVVEVSVAPLFLYGRYRKLSREIPQTRWPCRRCRGKGCDRCQGKGRMYETSVEEVIAASVMAQIGGTGHALHGMGREDVDALMLGNGRPFVVEISEPSRRTVDVAAATERVNRSGLVEIEGLRMSKRSEVVALKEDRADKTYRARIRLGTLVPTAKLKEAIEALSGTRVAQRTPTRVSHRRTDRVRHRTLRSIELIRADGREADVTVTAEAGTYIKEAVHGDGGRTVPSLTALLGVPCEVLELDVIRIHDEG